MNELTAVEHVNLFRSWCIDSRHQLHMNSDDFSLSSYKDVATVRFMLFVQTIHKNVSIR